MIKEWLKKLLTILKGDILLQRLIFVIILSVITVILVRIFGIE